MGLIFITGKGCCGKGPFTLPRLTSMLIFACTMFGGSLQDLRFEAFCADLGPV